MDGRWSGAATAYIEDSRDRVALLELVGDEVVIRAVNRALASLFGRAVEDFTDQPGARFYPPDELADVTAKVRATIASGEVLTYEAVRELPQGRLVVVGRMLPLPGGRVLAVGSDVSRERRAERWLAELEALAQIGLWAWNVVDDEVVWSDQYRALHGFGPDVPPSAARALDRVHPDDRAWVEQLADEVRDVGLSRPVRYRIVPRDGELRWVEGRAETVRDARGQVVRVVGTVQDVTEQHAAEERGRRLDEAAERQAHAMELNDDIVQELSRAWLALELGDVAAARGVIERTTRRVQDIVTGLLRSTCVADGELSPGDLVRRRPAGSEPS